MAIDKRKREWHLLRFRLPPSEYLKQNKKSESSHIPADFFSLSRARFAGNKSPSGQACRRRQVIGMSGERTVDIMHGVLRTRESRDTSFVDRTCPHPRSITSHDLGSI